MTILTVDNDAQQNRSKIVYRPELFENLNNFDNFCRYFAINFVELGIVSQKFKKKNSQKNVQLFFRNFFTQKYSHFKFSHTKTTKITVNSIFFRDTRR